jgi:L-2,4-diaminobutyrate transaminase
LDELSLQRAQLILEYGMPDSTSLEKTNLRALDKNSLIHPFSALRTQSDRNVEVMRSASGIWLTDDGGRQFIDAGSGLWCANVGYGRKSIVAAAAAQMEKTSFLHSFSNFTHEPLALLTERLLALAPAGFDRIVYGTSGSDANDTQVKLVRRYNNVRGKPAKKKIIARRSSYHGSTVAAGSLSGLSMVHRTFDLPMAGILHTHAADYYRRPDDILSEEDFSRYLASELDKLIEAEGSDTVAAFIAEPVVGAGGLLVPPRGYFREIHKVLRKHDVLMIADEVITGFGRTGHWFASPHFEVQPDLISLAKGLTSGYFPMSACLISKTVSDVLYAENAADGYFGHGFTSTGHPVGAAVALANIDILESEQLLQNAVVVGQHLLERLRAALLGHPLVGDIRGAGLMIGVELDRNPRERRQFDNPDRVASLLSKACFDQGLIVRGAHGRVLAAIAPPLILTKSDADEIVRRLEKAMDDLLATLAHDGTQA